MQDIMYLAQTRVLQKQIYSNYGSQHSCLVTYTICANA